MITVFTPTYNRAYILPNLYVSLQKQTCKDFEWLIVDDGSTDNTEALVRTWSNEYFFDIRYVRQQNGGKHRAINNGMKLAKGDFVFIVDSDDCLPDDAIKIIVEKVEDIKDKDDIAGIVGFKVLADGKKVNSARFEEDLICNVIDYQYRYHGVGDMAEVYRTSVLKNYPFPDIKGENFCTESLVWNRIGRKYKMLFFNKNIYVCEYLDDGLTSNIVKLRHRNPVYATTFYSETIMLNVPFVAKIRNAINYWRFYFDKSEIKKPRIPFIWLFVLPIGLIINIIEKYEYSVLFR